MTIPDPAPVFYYDFGSPNAYLAHRVLPKIERRTSAKFHYTPVLLGGLFKLSGNRSPVEAFANVPLRLAYDQREIERFVSWHGLGDFRPNPYFPVNTLMLMRGAVAAEGLGVSERYIEAVFHFMWEDPRKLDDPAELTRAFGETDLPTKALLALAVDQDIKDRLAENTRLAHERGAFGVPTFLIGEELYFGKDRLEQVETVLMSSDATHG